MLNKTWPRITWVLVWNDNYSIEIKSQKTGKDQKQKKGEDKKEESKVVDPLIFKPIGYISDGELKGYYYHMPHF